MELGGEGKEIPRGLPCPSCTSKPVGRLRRHASYIRTCKSFSALSIQTTVLRLWCPKCETSHACAFEQLLPYRRQPTESLAQLVEPYFFEEKSYEQLGWEVSADEGEGHRHLAFRLVARLCEMREWITSFIERQRHKLQGSLWRREEPEPQEVCPNAYKAKLVQKKAALNQVREALEKFRKLSGGKRESLIGLLHEASRGLRTPFSLLTCTQVVRLYPPQNWGDALF